LMNSALSCYLLLEESVNILLLKHIDKNKRLRCLFFFGQA
jgi:hypothetical protein